MTHSEKGFRYLLAGAALIAAIGVSASAQAEVGVGININLGPPPIVVAQPPEVVMIPGSQVHFVPDPQIDIFFYGGYWWSPRGDRWYRARAYNGPWGVIERHRVPRAVFYVPRDFRVRYEREHHVPYGQWKKDHDRWDRENRKAHRRWEKEREKEWKERERHHDGRGRGDDHDDDHGGDRGDGGGHGHGRHGR